MIVSKLTIIGSDNGLSPGRRQAIIWTNEYWNIVNWALRNKRQWSLNRNGYIFVKNMHLKTSSGKWRPICLSLNVLNQSVLHWWYIDYLFNTLTPRQNDRHRADAIFKFIFFLENCQILIKISMKISPRVQLTVIQHWFVAWQRKGDNLLSEPMVTKFSGTYMLH